MKNTICWSNNDLNIKENQSILKETILQGNLVIFPTETVYGIGANGLNPEASKRIYQAKGRPSDNPLILHIADRNDLYKYVRYVSEDAEKLMDAFWPGPLTMVFEKNELVPKETSGGLETVAIRFPKDKTAQQVIKLAGVPIAAPSANISGKPSSTKFEHVLEDFNGRVDIIIDGGPSEIGLESTVIDMTGDIPTILRPGYVTKKMVEKVLKYTVQDVSGTKPTGQVKSPGMKYTHYKPKGEVLLIRGSIEKMAAYVCEQKIKLEGHKIAVICESEYQELFNVNVVPLGSKDNQLQMAHNLFSSLRDMDKESVEYIYIHYLNKDELGYALMNRLEKAAGYQILDL
ncbi:L-threonylcarbamoyladenylate synthase [Acholeplasma hippikon]|uniref:L-threonylcarbamoyladenylate synthase n=1 Tax=Acholeplasma hippikon TaxID=264636 RepID=UPI00068A74E7|nr:L-threonylcarbamoyladenylate synthase [Acholeplasma hippikon]